MFQFRKKNLSNFSRWYITLPFLERKCFLKTCDSKFNWTFLRSRLIFYQRTQMRKCKREIWLKWNQEHHKNDLKVYNNNVNLHCTFKLTNTFRNVTNLKTRKKNYDKTETERVTESIKIQPKTKHNIQLLNSSIEKHVIRYSGLRDRNLVTLYCHGSFHLIKSRRLFSIQEQSWHLPQVRIQKLKKNYKLIQATSIKIIKPNVKEIRVYNLN